MKCRQATDLGRRKARPHTSSLASTRAPLLTAYPALQTHQHSARASSHLLRGPRSHYQGVSLKAHASPLESPSTASTANSTPAALEDRPAPLALHVGASVLPHPSKVLKGGEDWYFIAGSQRAMGVADGVGGWAGVGIDAGLYARRLMLNASIVADEQASSAAMSCSDIDDCEALYNGGQIPDVRVKLSAQQILSTAYGMTNVKGSSTVCIAILNGTSLQASNLGDSGLMVMREGVPEGILVATSQQQHNFNFPYQIGGDGKGDQPHQADRYEVEVQAGDILVMATDGLWDNCYSDEIVRVVRHCREAGFSPRKAARTLAVYARRRAADITYQSPFALVARKAGIPFMGGKMDDITVLLAYVEPAGTNVSTIDETDLSVEDGEEEASEPGAEPGWSQTPEEKAMEELKRAGV